MKCEQPNSWLWWLRSALLFPRIGLLLVAWMSSVAAQDIRGIEVCTAEKQMERRTGCLQANVEFLEQALKKLASETQEKIASTNRELGDARDEIAVLKSTIGRLSSELDRMKAKAESSGKK
jgi:chromosome segregation ATPase